MLAYNNTWRSVDAVGVTAYIDCGSLGSSARSQRTALMSVDAVLDLCEAAVPSIAYSWQAQVRSMVGKGRCAVALVGCYVLSTLHLRGALRTLYPPL